MSHPATEPIRRPQVVAALRCIGVEAGDILLVHSFLGVFGRFEGGLDAVVGAFQDAVGPDGTLVFPTYTVKFLSGREYDHDLTPSETGVLSEHFRRLPGVGRTFHPVYSHAVWGKKKDEYLTVVSRETLGRDSLFGRLHADDALNVFFGTSMNRGATFLHHFERMAELPYRYLKTFRGTVIKEGRSSVVEVDHYARDLKQAVELNFNRLQERVVDKRLAKVTPLGRGTVLGIRLKELYAEAARACEEDPFYLVRRPAGSGASSGGERGGGPSADPAE